MNDDMKFDTTRSDCILGIFLNGSASALSVATAIMLILDDPDIVIAANIILIVAAVLFLFGVLLIMMNSREVGDTQVNDSASFMVTALFLVAMFTLVLAGIITSL